MYHQLKSFVQFSCSTRSALVSVRRSSAPPGSHGSGGDGSTCASWRRCPETWSNTRLDCRAHTIAPAPGRTHHYDSLCSPGCQPTFKKNSSISRSNALSIRNTKCKERRSAKVVGIRNALPWNNPSSEIARS